MDKNTSMEQENFFTNGKQKITPIEIGREMQDSFLQYAMSVIVARALPDVRDGLKPVHRRILYTMFEKGLTPDKAYHKCADTVGAVLGSYHPHGDASVYDALVRLAQNFSMRYMLVDGQGNFGSVDGDPPAAYRYTEARMSRIALEMLTDIHKETVPFIPNYDDRLKEPEVLPSRFPNILVNGSIGIAVGMATNIPPHNLGEVIDTVMAYIDQPEMETEALLSVLKGPDFPTGGIIANKSELPAIYETGTGRIKLRARMEVELGKRRSDRDKLVITEIPYTMIGAGINKCLSDIADLVESKKLADVVDISNQSNKEGIRIVLELKKDADIEKIQNILYKKTKLEDTFGVNMLAIANGRPETLNLKGILKNYLDFQYENNTRKYQVLLEKEQEKKEIKEGLITACDCIDLIIAILRGSKNLKDAKACLMEGDISKIQFRTPGFEEDAKKLHFTEKQASAILEMRLYKLIGLEILALQKEYKETLRKIKEYQKILGSREAMDEVIKEDLQSIKEEFAVERRTKIEDGREAVYDEAAESARPGVFVLDKFGYCKILEPSIYERNRETVDTENVYVLPCHTTDKIGLFTDLGAFHQVKVTEIPFGKLRDKGVPIDNLSKFDATKERPVCVVNAAQLKGQKLLFATKDAMIKIVPGGEFETNNRTVAATKLQENDMLLSVQPADGMKEAVIQTTSGIFLRFPIEEISEMKKNAKGVRGIKLGRTESLETIHLLDGTEDDPIVMYKEKPVHLSRLKIGHRDGKGSRARS